MVKFPKIESFHNKVKAANRYECPYTLWDIKPKMHGTNASIRMKDGMVTFQSRKNEITPENDNFGFAAWAAENVAPYLLPLEYVNEYIIWGEWVGKGINHGDAVNQLEEKHFLIFGISLFGEDEFYVHHSDSNTIKSLMNDIAPTLNTSRVRIIPSYITFLDLNTQKGQGDAADMLNEIVSEFEDIDPYVKKEFEIEGPGEGIVVIPTNHASIVDLEQLSNWAFKVKTEKHQTNKTNKPAVVKAPASKEVIDFVDMFVTEARLQQALTELEIDFDRKYTGDFLKWVGKDIQDESKDELEASGLEWKTCSKLIQERAKKWFFNEGEF